eukprot:g4924.t1
MGVFAAIGRASRNKFLVLLAGIVVLALFGVGMRDHKRTYKTADLWIKEGGQVAGEIAYGNAAMKGIPVTGSSTHFYIMTDKTDASNNVLTREHLLEAHGILEAVKNIEVNVTINGTVETFRTEDVCPITGFAPYQFPCQTISPFDCFKEGEADKPQAWKDYINTELKNRVDGILISNVGQIVECLAPGPSLNERAGAVAVYGMPQLLNTQITKHKLNKLGGGTTTCAVSAAGYEKAVAHMIGEMINNPPGAQTALSPTAAGFLKRTLGITDLAAAAADPDAQILPWVQAQGSYTAAQSKLITPFALAIAADYTSAFTSFASSRTGMSQVLAQLTAQTLMGSGSVQQQATSLATAALGLLGSTMPALAQTMLSLFTVAYTAPAAKVYGAAKGLPRIDDIPACDVQAPPCDLTLHATWAESCSYALTKAAEQLLDTTIAMPAGPYGAAQFGGFFISSVGAVVATKTPGGYPAFRAEMIAFQAGPLQWGKDAAALRGGMNTIVNVLASQWSASEEIFKARKDGVAVNYGNGLFYGRRPRLATATPEQIRETLSAQCKIWDDPLFDFLPSVQKELVIGGETWDTTGGLKTGWSNTATIRGQNTFTPWVRKAGSKTSRLANATALEAIFRHIASTKLRNRLRGMGGNGDPLAATDPVRCKDFPGKVCRGPQVPEKFSKRGRALEISVPESFDILEAWEKAFMDLHEKPAIANATKMDMWAYGANSFSNELKENGVVQPVVAVAGVVASIVFAFLVLAWDGGLRMGLAGFFGGILLLIAICAGYGLGAAMGVAWNPMILQVLPFFLLAFGINDMYVLAHAAIAERADAKNVDEWVEGVVEHAGPSVLLTSTTMFVIFLIVRATRIPLVIEFSTIAAVSEVFLFLTNIFLFPCLLRLAWSESDRGRDAGYGVGNAFYCLPHAVFRFVHKLKLAQIVTVLCVVGGCLVAGGLGFDEVIEGLHQKDIAPSGTRFNTAVKHRFDKFQYLPSQITARTYDFAPAYNQLNHVMLAEQLSTLDTVLSPLKIWLHDLVRWANPDRSTNSKCGADFFTRGRCGPQLTLNPVWGFEGDCRHAWVKAGVDGMPGLYDNTTKKGLFFEDRTDPKVIIPAVPMDKSTCKGRNVPGKEPFPVVPAKWTASGTPICVRTANSATPAEMADAHRYKDLAAAGITAADLAKHQDWCMVMPRTEVRGTGFDTTLNIYKTGDSKGMAYCLSAFKSVDTNPTINNYFVPEVRKDEAAGYSPLCVDNTTTKDKFGIAPGCPYNRTVSNIRWCSDKYACPKKEDGFSIPEQKDDTRGSGVAPVDKAEVYGMSINFEAFGLSSDAKYIELIEQVRGLLDTNDADGDGKADPMQYFPEGDAFKYWAQYIGLKEEVLQWLGVEFALAFVVVWLMLFTSADADNGMVKNIVSSLWGSFLNTCVCAIIVAEFYGFLGWAGVKLSAIPSTIIWMSVGFAFEFTSHYCHAFMTTQGADWRNGVAIERMLTPTLNGAISSVIGVLPLLDANFDFVRLYYLETILWLILFASVNGLFVLPAVLGLLGPPSLKKAVATSETANPAAEVKAGDVEQALEKTAGAESTV